MSETPHDENTFKEIAAEVAPLYPLVWTPEGKIVFRSTADGTPNLLTNFKSHSLEDFSWSPDGKKLAVSRVKSLNDVVLIEKAKQ